MGFFSDPVRTGLAAAVASMCFGASVVATRYAVAQTHPVSLAFMRYSIGIFCLSPVLWRVARSSIPRRDVFAIGALGVLFFGVFPWSFSASLTYNASSRVAVEIATMPLLTLLISRLRGYDRITTPKLIGQLLAFAGLFLALRPPASAQATVQHAWMGDALAGVTALCGALYNVLSRPYLKKYPPLHVTSLAMLAGVLFLAPIAAMQGVFAAAPVLTGTAWLALLFLGTLGGAFGFTLWSWALKRSTPSRVAVFIALNPLTAITLGALLLNEAVTWPFMLGLLGVIGGIILANWQPANAVAVAQA